MSLMDICQSINLVVGTDQVAVSAGPGDSFLYFIGAQLSPAAAASTLTVYDGPAASNKVLTTVAAPASGGTALGGPFMSVPTQSGSIHYTLSGSGATAQLFWRTG